MGNLVLRGSLDKRRAMGLGELLLNRNCADGACPTSVYYFIQRQERAEASFVLDFYSFQS